MENLVDKDKEAEEKYILHVWGEAFKFKVPKLVRNIFLSSRAKKYWEGFQTQDKQSLKNIETKQPGNTDLQRITLELRKCKRRVELLEEPNCSKPCKKT